MNLKEISKKLPAKIKNHSGELTIVKRVKNNKYYCYYPFAVCKESEATPIVKGNSIESVSRKMYKNLLDRNIISVEKKKKVKKVYSKRKSHKTKEQIRKYKLTRQKNLLKSK